MLGFVASWRSVSPSEHRLMLDIGAWASLVPVLALYRCMRVYVALPSGLNRGGTVLGNLQFRFCPHSDGSFLVCSSARGQEEGHRAVGVQRDHGGLRPRLCSVLSCSTQRPTTRSRSSRDALCHRSGQSFARSWVRTAPSELRSTCWAS